jgi:hypothetical protein
MPSDTEAIRDDLAFLRALVQGGDDFLRGFGRGYFAGGVCYLVQTLLGEGQALGWVPSKGLLALVIAFGPTVVFLVALAVIISRGHAPSPGQASRTMGAIFGAVGLANLVLIAVIGSIAWRERSFTIWMIYPCTVFIMQGAAWLTTYALRRRAWAALVAAIWFVCALGMGFGVRSFTWYLAFASLGLGLGMAAPGAWLMTRPRA